MGLADELRAALEEDEATRLEFAVLDELETYLFYHGQREERGKPAVYGLDMREVLDTVVPLAMMRCGYTPAEIEEMRPAWVEGFLRMDA
jgi:hypothetical protein